MGSLALGCGEICWWVLFVLVEFFLCMDVNEIKYLGCKFPQVCDNRGDGFDGCGTDLPPDLGLEEGHQCGIDGVLQIGIIMNSKKVVESYYFNQKGSWDEVRPKTVKVPDCSSAKVYQPEQLGIVGNLTLHFLRFSVNLIYHPIYLGLSIWVSECLKRHL